jgi:tetratricopeptide (TPR) repeat protein
LDLFKKTTNIIAHIYYQNKAYSKALQIFRKLRDAAQEDLDYVMKCFAYSMMGKCYQGIKEYSKAVICFKKQLQLAWHTSNIDKEMNAYDNLAI